MCSIPVSPHDAGRLTSSYDSSSSPRQRLVDHWLQSVAGHHPNLTHTPRAGQPGCGSKYGNQVRIRALSGGRRLHS